MMTELQTDMLERVARAICEADPKTSDPNATIQWEGKRCAAWEAYVPQARAAIAEMGEEFRDLCAIVAGD